MTGSMRYKQSYNDGQIYNDMQKQLSVKRNANFIYFIRKRRTGIYA